MSVCRIFAFRSHPIQLELLFELAISNAQEGHKVIIHWGGEDVFFNDIYKGRISNLWGRPFYRMYSKVREKGLDISLDDVWLKTRFDAHPIIDAQADSVFDYYNLKFEEYEMGTAAISSCTDIFGVDVTALEVNDVKAFFNMVMSSNVNVNQTAKKFLRKNHTDKVLVFNGRFGAEAAVADAAKSCSVPCFFYEWIANTGYICWPFQIHNIRGVRGVIADFWATGSQRQNTETARAWLDERRKSTSFKLWENSDTQTSFEKIEDRTAFLAVNKLPNNYFVFFQSSDDEVNGVSAFARGVFPWKSQLEFVENLVRALPDDATLVLRLHPNMQDKKEIDTQRWHRLASRFDKIIFFDERSTIDSYSLSEHAAKVLCFGSTIGGEALYLGTPVLSGSRAYYEDAQGYVELQSYRHTIESLYSKIEVQQDSVLPWAYFRAAFTGIEPGSFVATGKYDVEFEGVNYWKGIITNRSKK